MPINPQKIKRISHWPKVVGRVRSKKPGGWSNNPKMRSAIIIKSLISLLSRDASNKDTTIKES